MSEMTNRFMGRDERERYPDPCSAGTGVRPSGTGGCIPKRFAPSR